MNFLRLDEFGAQRVDGNTAGGLDFVSQAPLQLPFLKPDLLETAS